MLILDIFGFALTVVAVLVAIHVTVFWVTRNMYPPVSIPTQTPVPVQVAATIPLPESRSSEPDIPLPPYPDQDKILSALTQTDKSKQDDRVNIPTDEKAVSMEKLGAPGQSDDATDLSKLTA